MTSTCSLFWLDDFMRRPWAKVPPGYTAPQIEPPVPTQPVKTQRVAR